MTAVRDQLEASQTAKPDEINLYGAVLDRASDLKRITDGICYGRNPPGDFTLKKIEAVASRLLQAAEAYRLAHGL